ncbi:Organic cation transporter protein [Frankliniella fusca]|uniref:Organic cation transporter protein n=1 Tax=Frankliniella fusca TaxID=407009 RepID=A0AAE1HH30_9NEOP|nr:Organic cation transporter protein [Frankliniella fusca]
MSVRNEQCRCLIPECETAASAIYRPPWLHVAVPVHDETPETCSLFQRNTTGGGGGGGGGAGGGGGGGGDGTCPADLFDPTRTERCTAWVYEPGQRATIVDEWNITCDDNKWKLTLVGTIGYIGAFLGMPLAGFVSDRFGRKTLLAWAWVLASLSGIVQSFSTSLLMFLLFEFLDSFFEAGVYGAGFLLALEFVGPRQRVLTTTVLSMFYSSGNALLGALAWAVRDWRWLLRAVYGGGLVFALPLWFTPESVRWLATRGRLEEADAIVSKVAAINKVPVNETLSSATRKAPLPGGEQLVEVPDDAAGAGTMRTLVSLFKSRTLALRFINCAYCWMANTFVYYGLSLNAVTLSGDEYVNFILSGLVELPANLLSLWLQDYVGRRWTLAGTLIVSGVCCLAFLGVPAGGSGSPLPHYLPMDLTLLPGYSRTDEQWLQVALYMLGKFAITISFIVIYVITAEMFPTNIRQSMVSYGSTFGRIGSILAPQTPLLATVSESLPLTLFGVVSLSSGLLAFLFPETKGRPLPETLDEAERMGRAPGPCSCSPGTQEDGE